MSDIKNRQNRFVVYFNDAELSALNQKAKRTNLSRGEFIREAITNKPIHEIPPIEYNKFIFELRRVGQNLNRLLQIAYSNGLLDVPKIRDCLNEIRTIDKNIHSELFGNKTEINNGNNKY